MIEDEDTEISQAQEETPAEEPTGVQAAVDRAVEKWIDLSVRNSPLARHTASYNSLREKLPVLSKLIIQELEA